MTTYRPATSSDSEACFRLFEAAIDDLGRRTGTVANYTSGDPDAWLIRRPLFEHLASTAHAWWIAEDEAGVMEGYARSIERTGTRELTEFFVRPDAQAGGIGRELLARTFPDDGVHRSIIATTDVRAVSRYLRAGLDARVPLAGFEAAPRAVTLASDLRRERLVVSETSLAEIGAIDEGLLGFRRDVDHRWLASQRPGWLYRRAAAVVGYAYHPTRPSWGGPLAVLDASDLPVLLADAETAAFDAGHATVTFDISLVARAALDHLLGRGFRIDPFLMLYFSDGPADGLDRYVLTSPPFFL